MMCREHLACLLREIGSCTTRLPANIVLPSPFRTCVRQHCQRWKQLRHRTGRHLVMLVVRCTWLPGVCCVIERLCELYEYHISHWLNSPEVLYNCIILIIINLNWMCDCLIIKMIYLRLCIFMLLKCVWLCVTYVDVMLQECRGIMKAWNRRKACPNSSACIRPPDNLL